MHDDNMHDETGCDKTTHDKKFYRSADGLQLFYRDYSAHTPVLGALPVLCMHGLTRNSRDFGDLATHLSERCRVIVPDVRGRGFSEYDADPTHYQPPVYADDMWCLLDHLGIARCILSGTSMGGLMAMIMAVQQPQRIAGIVLNDVGTDLDEAGVQRIKSYVGSTSAVGSWTDAANQCRYINAVALPDLTDADWLQFAHNTYRENEQGIPSLDYDPNIAKLFAQTDFKAASDKVWQVFTAIHQPVLLLRGALSDLLSAATVAAMRRRHLDLTAVEIPQRGHAPLLSEPTSLVAIDTFIERLNSTVVN